MGNHSVSTVDGPFDCLEMTMQAGINLSLFEAIVEQAPDAIIFADRSGMIRVWNSSAEAVFGYSTTEVVGGNLDIIIPERLRSAHWHGFRRAIETGHAKYVGRVLTTRAVHKN